MRFDGHTHVFEVGLPLRSGRRYTPDRGASPERLLGVLERHGLAGAVLVQPSFLADPDFAFDAAAAAPGRFRVVPSPDDLAELDRCRDRWTDAGMVGVRLNLVGRGLPDLVSPGWRSAGAALAAAGVHLEVHAEGGQWEALGPMLASWPSQVVVDHLGRHAHPRGLLGLGRLDHVWFKVSAPYRWPDRAAALRLAADLLESTDGRRLIWGSDWPFTQHEGTRYEGVLDEVHRALPAIVDIADANLQRLLGAQAFPTGFGTDGG